MQMFGVGLPEVMVILLLSVLVIGPDRVPQFAADLARWIRRARAYGEHLTRDFNDVIGDLEREVGASREDWKEIASVVTRHTGDLTRELSVVTSEVNRPIDLAEAKRDEPTNVVPIESARESVDTEPAQAEEPEAADGTKPAAEEKPWYVPETSARRRSSE